MFTSHCFTYQVNTYPLYKINNFLRKGCIVKVKTNEMIQQACNGHLKAPDLETQIKSLK